MRIFKADLNEEGSFDEAVRGCDGVFHVAASMEFNVDHKENIGNVIINQCFQRNLKWNTQKKRLHFEWIEHAEAYVQANIIDPSIKGTLNLLKSCMNSSSVKRVVLTSSISTITAKDSNGKWKPVVDESCQIQTEHVLKIQASGWVINAFPGSFHFFVYNVRT